ncbi:hypothetical protein NDU88_004436 [Pleurodeles waltl]|uniref:Uncharacterized protein n=1 Tax=Pleurodeles waltl TaxID=8319 RepID=A0AAV7T847_PLEWA|nr:hypothetical protein NDU88_004436 [Pleurodeles waltl]
MSSGEALDIPHRKASALTLEGEMKEVPTSRVRARIRAGCLNKSASALRQQEKQTAHAARTCAASAPYPQSTVTEAAYQVESEGIAHIRQCENS